MLTNHRLLSPILLVVLIALVACVGLSTRANNDPANNVSPANPTVADGLAAWSQIYSVMISPRCLNCHTATNYPQQGDDRHRHFANVIRGQEGRGVTALRCIGCHQEVNADSTGVPGGPDWHLAPLSMQWQDTNDRPLSSAAVCRSVTDRSKNEKMDGRALLTHHQEVNADSTGVPGGPDWHLAPLSMQWQDANDRPLSSAAVCRSVTDRSKNEKMDGRALLTHHQEAALVLWAWNPGRRPDGTTRSLPPMTHEAFVAATRTWVDAGTPCPRGR